MNSWSGEQARGPGRSTKPPTRLRGNGAVAVAATAVLLLATSHIAPAQAPPSGEKETGADQLASKVDRREAERQRRAQPGNLVGHGGPVKAVATDAANGRALTGSFDYAMMVWKLDSERPQQLTRLDDHNGAVNAVAFVPGGKFALAAGDDGAVAQWDLATGKLVHRLEGHSAKIVGLAVSSDGRWAASASWDRTARIWDLAQGKAGPVLTGHTGPVNAVAFSADSAHVYTASYDGSIGLWNRSDGSFVRPLYNHGWGINVLMRLPGTERLAFGALNGAAAILDAPSGEVVAQLPAHERPVLALAVNEKPGLIATSSSDGVIRVVRADDAAPIEEYRNPYGPVWALAFAADGTALYYGGLDDFATLWRLVPREPFEPVDSPYPRRFQVRAQPNSPLAAGELQFARKCSVCHTLQRDGRNRAGPTLFRLFGRKVGTLPDYPYSPALQKMDIVWTPETLGKLFALGPDAFTPGSKMPLQVMSDPAQRDALIAYLKIATEPESAEQSIDVGGASSAESPRKGEKK